MRLADTDLKKLELILKYCNHEGLWTIMGGTVIAQDLASSKFFDIPTAAIDTGSVDFVLPLNEITSALVNVGMIREAAN